MLFTDIFIFLRNPTKQLSLLLPLYNRHVPAFSVKCCTNIRLYFYIYLFIGRGKCMPWHKCAEGRTTYGSWFSPTHMDPQMDSGNRDWQREPFPIEPLCQPTHSFTILIASKFTELAEEQQSILKYKVPGDLAKKVKAHLPNHCKE